jgi:hypothetical protein
MQVVLLGWSRRAATVPAQPEVAASAEQEEAEEQVAIA